MKVNLLGGVQGLWLVTGAAGFIGSNLVETLLLAGQQVRAIDNFATGHRQNLDAVLRSLPTAYAANFTLVEGDITDSAVCMQAMKGVRRVVHLAALGSVPRSLDNPINTNAANITGFLNILDAARR
ncbi:MAG: GDP-mannose 4,6-dehydratase, partial [Alphaproteobacteria bacterium]|nr:GDP-mannose 4,6-dehydratase [Alphaproteobacteria bacterium]